MPTLMFPSPLPPPPIQVFFAFVGFDMVATAAEESVNPLRDVPVATVGSVVICGAMYVLMAVAIVGMVPYTQVSCV